MKTNLDMKLKERGIEKLAFAGITSQTASKAPDGMPWNWGTILRFSKTQWLNLPTKRIEPQLRFPTRRSDMKY
jgi:hypothetical protein